MAVWNLGSINIDRFYQVDHLPAPGETLAARSFSEGLGGKGANMSVAIARAGARACHIGAVGADGLWARDRLLEYGVDTRFIAQLSETTGHAIINVAADGENQIVLMGGANTCVPEAHVAQALTEARTGDIFITQNETNGQSAAAKLAKQLGLAVAYAAAPFDADAVQALLPQLDYLFLNEVEAAQLESATGHAPAHLGIAHTVVTRGANGAVWYDASNAQEHHIPAVPTEVIDTTGAGDTFTGFAIAGLDRGLNMRQSLRLAAQAAAIMVSRKGTADVIPDLKDVEDARLS